MDKLRYLLPVFICPISMGAMMWFMMRGKKSADAPAVWSQDADVEKEIAGLRAEIATLRANAPGPGGSDRVTAL